MTIEIKHKSAHNSVVYLIVMNEMRIVVIVVSAIFVCVFFFFLIHLGVIVFGKNKQIINKNDTTKLTKNK